MMNWLKELMLFTLLILVIQLKKADYKTNIYEIEKKVHDRDHDNYYTRI